MPLTNTCTCGLARIASCAWARLQVPCVCCVATMSPPPAAVVSAVAQGVMQRGLWQLHHLRNVVQGGTCVRSASFMGRGTTAEVRGTADATPIALATGAADRPRRDGGMTTGRAGVAVVTCGVPARCVSTCAAVSADSNCAARKLPRRRTRSDQARAVKGAHPSSVVCNNRSVKQPRSGIVSARQHASQPASLAMLARQLIKKLAIHTPGFILNSAERSARQ